MNLWRTMAPCGHIRHTVPRATGCEHWIPGYREPRPGTKAARKLANAMLVAELQRILAVKRPKSP